ncbi:hypothetical protein JCM5353_007635 [Sporobolomyces roseus]
MAHRSAPDAHVASHADIEQRIRRFYSYWDDAVGDIPSKDALPSDRIDIELEVLPEDEAAQDPIGFPKAEQIRRDNTWAVVFNKQAHPVWQQITSAGRVLNETDLSTLFCFPRILGIQASVRNVKKEQSNELAMDEWLHNATFTKSSVADGSIDHWYQLPGRPILPGSVDERKKGSPSTPLFSPFRLRISRQGQPDETVVVIFRIAPDRHGILRPWKKAQPVLQRRSDNSGPHHRSYLPPLVSTVHRPLLSSLHPPIHENFEGPTVRAVRIILFLSI